MLVRALLIVDDAELERRLDRIFEPLEIALATAPHKSVLWDRVKAFPADLVVVGRSSLPDPIEDTVETIQALPERPEVIVVSEKENAAERARLLIAGCTAVLNATLDDNTLRDAFNAFVTRQRKTSIERLQHEIDSPSAKLSDFESASATMQSFLRIVSRVVEPDSSLLIQGETGVGKERLARAIHAASPRASGRLQGIGVHPTPPGLNDSTAGGRRNSRLREAELDLIARQIGQVAETPWIVTSDFNDVAWSHTSRLFKRLSGLRDPRVGRTLLNSYHAERPWMRFPIDQMLFSEGFAVRSLKRVTIPGSDHFGIAAEVQLAEQLGVTPNASEEDLVEAREVVREGNDDARDRDVHAEPGYPDP